MLFRPIRSLLGLVLFSTLTTQSLSQANQAFGLETNCRQQVQSLLDAAVLDTNIYFEVKDCDLTGFDFSDSRFRASFNNVNLSQANFSGTRLDSLSFEDSNLDGANFSKSILEAVSLRNCTGELVDFSDSQIGKFDSGQVWGYMVFSRLSDSNFKNAKIYAIMDQSSFEGSDFTDARIMGSFGKSNLVDAKFVGARIGKVNWESMDLSKLNFSGAIFQGGTFNFVDSVPPKGFLLYGNGSIHGFLGPGMDFSVFKFPEGIVLPPWTVIDLRGADLSGSTLRGTYNYKLSGANLENTQITNGSSGCNYRGTPRDVPEGVKLLGGCIFGSASDLSGEDLSNLDLSGINLTGYKLNGANLQGTQLKDAVLDFVQASGIIGTPKSLPSNLRFKYGTLFGPFMDLSGLDFSGKNLAGMNLSNTNLRNTNFSNANLSKTDLSGAICEETNFTSANLTSANAYFAICGSAKLRNANLTSVNFTSATLANVSSGDLKGSPKTLPKDWKVLGGYLVGPKADLTGAKLGKLDFSKVNLTGAKLERAEITGVNFANARLDKVSSGGVKGIPKALPKDWKTIGGYLVGPTANLSEAKLNNLNLSRLNLSTANLAGANLAKAILDKSNLSNAFLDKSNLAGAFLKGANLTGANLTGANLTGAWLAGTNLKDAKLDSSSQNKNVNGQPLELPSGWRIVNGSLVYF